MAKRRVKTHYNGGHMASSTTVRRAIVAAFKRLMYRDYHTAQIYYDGKLITTLAFRRGVVVMTMYRPTFVGK